MGAHTKKHTHKNIPLLLGRQPLAHCSLPVNRRALCFLQQEPAAETCYCAMCRPAHNLTISQRLCEMQSCDSVFVFSPEVQETHFELAIFTQWTHSQQILGTFSVVQRSSRVTGTLFLENVAFFSHAISANISGLQWHFVQTFMVPRGEILTLVPGF